MNETTKKRMAIIFNEWYKQYHDEPERFVELFDENGAPVHDAGERAVITFNNIALELEEQGKLPN